MSLDHEFNHHLFEVVRPDERRLTCRSLSLVHVIDGVLAGSVETAYLHRLDGARRDSGSRVLLLGPLDAPLGEVRVPPAGPSLGSALRPIQVTASLESGPVGNGDYSVLEVTWFQRAPWPLPDDEARAALEKLEWDRLAQKAWY